eukprot:scaffold164387_cov13-Tisochrysis_lutea.AAC.2
MLPEGGAAEAKGAVPTQLPGLSVGGPGKVTRLRIGPCRRPSMSAAKDTRLLIGSCAVLPPPGSSAAAAMSCPDCTDRGRVVSAELAE